MEIGSAVAIFGTATAAILAIAGFAIKYFTGRKDNSWKDPLNNLDKEIITIKSDQQQILKAINDLKTLIEEHEARDEKDFERIEKAIDRLSDLVIKILQDKD